MMEQRKAFRSQLRLPVRYVTGEGTKVEGTTLTRDVGQNGLAIILPEQVPLGAPVNLEIRLPENNRRILAKGKVVWQTELANRSSVSGSRYATGLQFTRVDEGDRKELVDLVLCSLQRESEDASMTVRSLIDGEFTPNQRQFVFQKRTFLTDTNAEGNVYFARYFDWQGMAREDYFRHAVPDHMELMRTGTKLITVHAWIKYEHETHLFDEIVIKVRTTSLKRMTMELGFTYVNKQTAQVLAIGGQKLAFADRDGKLIPIPPSIRAGAATCLVEPGSEEWHMELTKRRASEQERLDSASKGSQEKKRR